MSKDKKKSKKGKTGNKLTLKSLHAAIDLLGANLDEHVYALEDQINELKIRVSELETALDIINEDTGYEDYDDCACDVVDGGQCAYHAAISDNAQKDDLNCGQEDCEQFHDTYKDQPCGDSDCCEPECLELAKEEDGDKDEEFWASEEPCGSRDCSRPECMEDFESHKQPEVKDVELEIEEADLLVEEPVSFNEVMSIIDKSTGDVETRRALFEEWSKKFDANVSKKLNAPEGDK